MIATDLKQTLIFFYNNSRITKIIKVLSAASVTDRKRVWKQSLYNVVNLTMPDNIRQQRLQENVKKILKSFPVFD